MKRTKSSDDSKGRERIFYLQSVSYTKNNLLILMTTLLLSQCTSCIHENSWHFNVKNLTEDTLVITTKSIIPDFNVQVNNYDNRSESEPKPEVYNNRFINVSDTIFVLPPNTIFEASIVWDTRDVLSDNPEADGVTPGWKFIKRMELGGQLLSPEIWNSEQKWRITWEYEDVDKAYSLIICDAHLK